MQSPLTHAHWFNIVFQYEASIPIKMGVMDGMVPSTILALGNDDHFQTVAKIQEGEVSISLMKHISNIPILNFNRILIKSTSIDQYLTNFYFNLYLDLY